MLSIEMSTTPDCQSTFENDKFTPPFSTAMLKSQDRYPIRVLVFVTHTLSPRRGLVVVSGQSGRTSGSRRTHVHDHFSKGRSELGTSWIFGPGNNRPENSS